jgi:hypothetical protein
MVFQFDHNHIHPDVAGVLRQVNSSGVILRIARFHGKGVFFPSGKLNCPLASNFHVDGWAAGPYKTQKLMNGQA